MGGWLWCAVVAASAEPTVKVGDDALADPGRWLERRRPAVEAWWRAQTDASKAWLADHADEAAIRAWLAADRARSAPRYLVDHDHGATLWNQLAFVPAPPRVDGEDPVGPRWRSNLAIQRPGDAEPVAVPLDPARDLCAVRLLTGADGPVVLFGETDQVPPDRRPRPRPCDVRVFDPASGATWAIGTFDRAYPAQLPDGQLLVAHRPRPGRTALDRVDPARDADGERRGDRVWSGRRSVRPWITQDGLLAGVSTANSRGKRRTTRILVGPVDDARWVGARFGRGAELAGVRANVRHDAEPDEPELLVTTARFGAGGNVVRVDPGSPRPRRWRFLVAERPGMDLATARLHGDDVLTVWTRDGLQRLEQTPYDGGPGQVVDLGGPTTAIGVWRSAEDRALVSAGTPVETTWYARDRAGALTWVATQTAVDGARFVSVEVESADGARVPVSLVVPIDPVDPVDPVDTVDPVPRPVLLSVYGGFDNAQSLRALSSTQRAWLAAGGVVGVVHARGGRERGDAWHEAAITVDHPRTYEDLIAAARGLVAQGIAAEGKVAVTGASNGGLTVIEATARDPGAFGAVVAYSGVYDLLRAKRFGRWWPREYGRTRAPDEAATLAASAPVYQTPPAPLPPIWLQTGEKDPVVAPVHSFKLASAWAEAPGGPVLLAVDPWGSHGGRAVVGKDLRAEAKVDGTLIGDAHSSQLLAFLFAVFGMALPAPADAAPTEPSADPSAPAPVVH